MSITKLQVPAQAVPEPEWHARPRPNVRGKFLWVGDQKLFVRGVTYGPFPPDRSGSEYGVRASVDRDLGRMVRNGINAVRTYTVPPRWLLEVAERHGIWVMVGLPWEQHVAFLDDPRIASSIEQRVRAHVRECARHPAILCYVIGNEIPASIVRWHGRRPLERFLERLRRAVKQEDPEGLVTYVNYPTTEYLSLPSLDLVCFNVYLEQRDQYEAYLARLQTLAGDRPLVMAEMGLDSRRNGEDGQARSLEWQIRSAFAAGCAGVFVFSWSDAWHRGGHDILDWDFGLIRRNREAKPALRAVAEAYAAVPFQHGEAWPRVSVVVCTYNGKRWIRDCLEGAQALDYPDYEVIVVNDGSTDGTETIAARFDVRHVRTENHGLSCARNLGMELATGEIVAYLDDDARPDPHWLRYLVSTFLQGDYVAVGGPNLAPPEDGPIAQCVARAPGGPVHVMLSDREAEHLPGCNLAIRKSALVEIGGFDPRFRAAGDDVDVCWRLQQRGGRLGFSPSAVVWHHPRNSLRAYWKQQYGYGGAEALLEQKWPEKYNAVGHPIWVGRVYGEGVARLLGWPRGRIYHGTWGSAPFQSLYEPAPNLIWSVARMPEWYLVVAALCVLSALGLLWPPLGAALPLLAVALGIPVVQSGIIAAQVRWAGAPMSLRSRAALRFVTFVLHLLQPLARLRGRLANGIAPWRLHTPTRLVVPRTHYREHWSEHWEAADQRLRRLESAIRAEGHPVHRGGDFDPWDLQIRGGLLGAARVSVLAEEHGGGRQMVRFRVRPHLFRRGIVVAVGLMGLSVGVAAGGSVLGGMALGVATALLICRIVVELGAALGSTLDVISDLEASAP